MRTQPVLHGLIVGASLLTLWPAAAQARPEYPGAITEAANMACVPTCLLCHTTSPGTLSTFGQRPVGNALLATGLMPGEPDTMQGAWDALVTKAAATPDAECYPKVSCKAIVDAVPLGIEPLTNLNACGPTYGCGATVAQRPLSQSQNNHDPAPAVAGALAAIAGVFALRRRRR